VPGEFAEVGTVIEIEARGRRSPALVVARPICRRGGPKQSGESFPFSSSSLSSSSSNVTDREDEDEDDDEQQSGVGLKQTPLLLRGVGQYKVAP
jgi:hypothetical protein